MKLIYRGTQYNAAPAFTASENSGITAQYRGLSYTISRASDAAAIPTQTLKYRGIAIGKAEFTYQQVSDPAMA